MQEIWKYIPWYEGLYQVSDRGNVKRIWWNVICWDTSSERWIYSRKINDKLLQFWKSHEYYRITLCKDWEIKSYLVHRLVAQLFLGLDITDKKMLVCHKNDNPKDNRVENLFLWTAKDNMEDCVNKWRIWRMFWQKNPRVKLNDTKISLIKLMLDMWCKQKDIAFRFLVNPSVISRISNWKAWNFNF